MSEHTSLLTPALPAGAENHPLVKTLEHFNQELTVLQLRAQFFECLAQVTRSLSRGQDPLSLALQVGRTPWCAGERMHIRNCLGLGLLHTPADIESHLKSEYFPYPRQWDEFVLNAATLGLEPFWESCVDSSGLDLWHYLRFQRLHRAD